MGALKNVKKALAAAKASAVVSFAWVSSSSLLYSACPPFSPQKQSPGGATEGGKGPSDTGNRRTFTTGSLSYVMLHATFLSLCNADPDACYTELWYANSMATRRALGGKEIT